MKEAKSFLEYVYVVAQGQDQETSDVSSDWQCLGGGGKGLLQE